MLKSGRRIWLVVAVVVLGLLAAGCGKENDTAGGDAEADTEVEGRVVVSGSSTVEPVSSAVAEAFRGQNDRVEIAVDGPGTGDGFELFCNDETDISDASRPIQPEEIEACEANGVEFIELAVGLDGLTVITNPDIELECMNFADLYALVGPESQGFADWTAAQPLAIELGSDSELPDQPLSITAPGEESGTYDSFIEIALEGIGEMRFEEGKLPDEDAAATTRPDYQASANDNAIIQGVSGSPGGFGWVGFAFADEAGEDVKKMPISEEPGGDCVEPTTESITDGTYPISRTLFIYVNSAKAEENPALAAYVDFYLEGLNGFVEQSGYTVLADDVADTTMGTWEDRTTGTTEGEDEGGETSPEESSPGG